LYISITTAVAGRDLESLTAQAGIAVRERLALGMRRGYPSYGFASMGGSQQGLPLKRAMHGRVRADGGAARKTSVGRGGGCAAGS
jgi:hypothetical protein